MQQPYDQYMKESVAASWGTLEGERGGGGQICDYLHAFSSDSIASGEGLQFLIWLLNTIPAVTSCTPVLRY